MEGAKALFLGLFWLEIVVNYDSGAVPAILQTLTAHFGLPPSLQGMLGGLQYLGLTVSSLFAGYLLQHYNTKWVLCSAIWLNTCCCALFALSPNTTALLIARAGIGISQTPVLIFAPVWVDEFATKGQQTVWMSLLQAAAPIGVMMGYATAGFLVESGVKWQYTILIQTALLVPIATTMCFVPSRYYNIVVSEEEEVKERSHTVAEELEDSPSEAVKNPISKMRPIESALESGSDRESSSSDRESSASSQRESSDGGKGAPAGQAAQSVPHTSMPHTSIPHTSMGTAEARADEGGHEHARVVRGRVDSLFSAASRTNSAAPDGGSSNGDFEGAQGASGPPMRKGVGAQLRIVMSSPIFVSVTLGLAALFFVVTGVQFWATDYLVIVLKADMAAVIGAFAATSATAPVLGVVFGGWYVDREGGYHGVEGLVKTARLNFFFAVVATTFAIGAAFARNMGELLGLMWFVLFFGGAIIPGGTGMILAAVPVQLRSFASAVSMLTYNIFGYAAGTIFPGLCMTALVSGLDFDGVRALEGGFRLVLFWALWGVLFLGIAAHFATKDAKVVANALADSWQNARPSRDEAPAPQHYRARMPTRAEEMYECSRQRAQTIGFMY
eukprot:g66.t1